jgi:DNA-binding response OmpR family regulator
VDDHSFGSYYGDTASDLVAGDASAPAERVGLHTPLQSIDGGSSQSIDGASSGAGTVLVYANLEIRPDEVQALADGRRVGLTVREFQVLCVLAQREDRVVRRADVYNQVWGGNMKHRDRSVDVFVRKVRSKLAHAAPNWSYIHTHFGVGYRFAPMPPSGDC